MTSKNISLFFKIAKLIKHFLSSNANYDVNKRHNRQLAFIASVGGAIVWLCLSNKTHTINCNRLNKSFMILYEWSINMIRGLFLHCNELKWLMAFLKLVRLDLRLQMSKFSLIPNPKSVGHQTRKRWYIAKLPYCWVLQ